MEQASQVGLTLSIHCTTEGQFHALLGLHSAV